MFKIEFSRWLHDAFDLRQRSDYAAQVQVSKEEASQMLAQAKAFVAGVKSKLMEE
jgi:uncharacterized protein (UPF0332 family)